MAAACCRTRGRIAQKQFSSNLRILTSSIFRMSSFGPMSRHYTIEAPDVTTVSRLSISGNNVAPVVTRFSTQGFTVSGNLVYGSVALLPTAFLHWKVKRFEDVTPETLVLFSLLHPPIEMLVLGVGAEIKQAPESIKAFLRSKAISLEIQDTPNACATFNFLLDEGRRVGGALIPPEYL